MANSKLDVYLDDIVDGSKVHSLQEYNRDYAFTFANIRKSAPKENTLDFCCDVWNTLCNLGQYAEDGEDAADGDTK